MMNKKYVTPYMELCEMETADVIATSNGILGSVHSLSRAQARLDTNGDNDTYHINGGGGQWDTTGSGY